MRSLAFLAVVLLAFPFASHGSASSDDAITIQEFTVAQDALCQIRDRWLSTLAERYPVGSWAPMMVEMTDDDLALLGLPNAAWLREHRFDEPTMVSRDGRTTAVPAAALAPTAAAYAGAGCVGIRPGALLLTITDSVIGWCSMAHVYGSPGSYSISTAGHCGKTGDIATVIAAYGNRQGVLEPIILDFGKYAKSTGDGGIGQDWALISVASQHQPLVSPTMCVWGGPIGVYTKTGTTAAFSYGRSLIPTISANPDPLLVQSIVHYGHGTGVGGPGVGTPRMGEVLDWRARYFTWFGAITPGDSGSGSNTVGGDAIGATREAAGINTHIYVDGLSLFKTGTGVLASTRATLVSSTMANGQLLPYPAPVPGAP